MTTPIYYNYHGVSTTTESLTQLLTQMDQNAVQMQNLATHLRTEFQGHGGSSNDALQKQFALAMADYIDALRSCNTTIANTAGLGGDMETVDKNIAASFSGIGVPK